MNIGENIIKYRKNLKFSQEQLAEKLGVTRQTISNWELNETSPDLKQAMELAEIFNISLDELTGSSKDKIYEKVSNTEKLAGIIIKIIKILAIIFVVILVIDIVSLILFASIRSSKSSGEITKTELHCTKNGETYTYGIEYDENYKIINAGGDAYISNSVDAESKSDALDLITDIENFFESNGGTCE